MNIKVSAFTVSEKSITTMYVIIDNSKVLLDREFIESEITDVCALGTGLTELLQQFNHRFQSI